MADADFVAWLETRFRGRHPAMRRVREELAIKRHSNLLLTILGPTGSGKKILAMAAWRGGPRAHMPYDEVRVTSKSPSQTRDELEGHKKGSFTTALFARNGFAAKCHGGTLLIDEAQDLPGHAQSRLLELVEYGTRQALGSDDSEPVDVRWILAFNRSPNELRAAGRLREDFFYRIHSFRIQIPPLSNHLDDVTELAAGFLDDHCRATGRPRVLTTAGIDVLMGHSWPGNVRELKRCVEAAADSTAEETLDAELLSGVIGGTARIPDDLLKEDLRRVIERVGKRPQELARALGVSRAQFYRKYGRVLEGLGLKRRYRQ